MKNTIAFLGITTVISSSLPATAPNVFVQKKQESKCIISEQPAPIFKLSMQNIIDEALKKEQQKKEKKLLEYNRKVSDINFENDRMDNVGYNVSNVNIKSNITVNELENIFKQKKAYAMCELASSIVEAEKEYDVNAFFLAGIIIQESGWGHHAAGNGDNLTGYCVYSKNYKGQSFNGSKHNNIMATAALLRNKYLNSDGKYFTGTSIVAINTNYCLHQDMKTVDYSWSRDIERICNDLVSVYHSDIKQLIPVPKFEQ